MSEKELSQYYWLKKEIKSLEDKIEEFGDGVSAVKIKDTIGSSGEHSSIQEKKTELISKLLDARITALEKYIEIERYIESVEDSEIRLIMRYRFLDLMNWNQIGEELHYDRTSVAKKLRQYISHNSHHNYDNIKLGDK